MRNFTRSRKFLVFSCMDFCFLCGGGDFTAALEGSIFLFVLCWYSTDTGGCRILICKGYIFLIFMTNEQPELYNLPKVFLKKSCRMIHEMSPLRSYRQRQHVNHSLLHVSRIPPPPNPPSSFLSLPSFLINQIRAIL